jgi:hypothetical protein
MLEVVVGGVEVEEGESIRLRKLYQAKEVPSPIYHIFYRFASFSQRSLLNFSENLKGEGQSPNGICRSAGRERSDFLVNIKGVK